MIMVLVVPGQGEVRSSGTNSGECRRGGGLKERFDGSPSGDLGLETAIIRRLLGQRCRGAGLPIALLQAGSGAFGAAVARNTTAPNRSGCWGEACDCEG